MGLGWQISPHEKAADERKARARGVASGDGPLQSFALTPKVCFDVSPRRRTLWPAAENRTAPSVDAWRFSWGRVKLCTDGCGPRGACDLRHGQCVCEPPAAGAACEIEVPGSSPHHFARRALKTLALLCLGLVAGLLLQRGFSALLVMQRARTEEAESLLADER